MSLRAAIVSTSHWHLKPPTITIFLCWILRVSPAASFPVRSLRAEWHRWPWGGGQGCGLVARLCRVKLRMLWALRGAPCQAGSAGLVSQQSSFLKEALPAFFSAADEAKALLSPWLACSVFRALRSFLDAESACGQEMMWIYRRTRSWFEHYDLSLSKVNPGTWVIPGPLCGWASPAPLTNLCPSGLGGSHPVVIPTHCCS